MVVWRGLAEVAEKYLKKGNQVYVEGKIRTRSWDDKDGVKRYTTEIVADQMTMLGKKDKNNMGGGMTNNQSAPSASSSPANNMTEEDDLPF